MSRDEQARELLRKHAGCAPHGLGQSVKTTAAIGAVTEALRGASGGGADAVAIERLRIMSKQKLASEMEDHEIDCADWRGGYECLVNEARAVFASIAPDHPAENAKSSGEVRAALGELDDYLAQLGGCGDGGCIIVKPKGMHTNGGCRCSSSRLTMQRFAYAHNRFATTVRTALARSGKGEG